MKIEYRKYTPKDIFISFLGREATEEELWHGMQTGIVYNKQTGSEFFDLFVEMVHHYMIHHPGFYVKKLNLTTTELSGCIKALTGLPADKWIEKYRWLVVADLLDHTDWPLGKIAGATGYSSVKTFSRAFIKHVGMPASQWRSAGR